MCTCSKNNIYFYLQVQDFWSLEENNFPFTLFHSCCWGWVWGQRLWGRRKLCAEGGRASCPPTWVTSWSRATHNTKATCLSPHCHGNRHSNLVTFGQLQLVVFLYQPILILLVSSLRFRGTFTSHHLFSQCSPLLHQHYVSHLFVC